MTTTPSSPTPGGGTAPSRIFPTVTARAAALTLLARAGSLPQPPSLTASLTGGHPAPRPAVPLPQKTSSGGRALLASPANPQLSVLPIPRRPGTSAASSSPPALLLEMASGRAAVSAACAPVERWVLPETPPLARPPSLRKVTGGGRARSRAIARPVRRR